MIFFTGDTHFGDPRILRLDRRPFQDLAAHDAALIERWNHRVGEGDEVWHLGDFARGTAEVKQALFARLNGDKHLITGNNDDEATLRLGWASVQAYAELDVEGRRLVLCHYPFRTWNGMGKGALNIHGHSHGKLKPLPRQYDVGIDVFPQGPATLTEILASRRRGAKPGAALIEA
ncbi:metallophosphoesterase family protein [Aureimonas sp. AU12]|uniref:metallophosphoesterase family protein n=1 Tax=Aureimonas sp. AU12 TaxID=1638161 RepID=UPI000786656C|nr:metallophosphoesterase family protein [Aureimonas sp. AU12]